MKLHFIISIVFVVVLTLLATNSSVDTRMLMLVACMVLFYITIIVFGVEMEKEKRTMWHQKEKKLIEETYARFVSEYHQTK